MGVDHRSLDIRVSKQLLKVKQVPTPHHEMGGKRVPEVMKAKMPYACPLTGRLEVPSAKMIGIVCRSGHTIKSCKNSLYSLIE